MWFDNSLQSNVTSVATGLGAGLLLQPRDELADGEGLGEGRAAVRAGARGRRGSSGLSGGSGGRSGGGSNWLGGSGSSRCSGLGGCGGSRAAAATAAGAVPDLGAGDGVGGLSTVHVVEDTLVVRGVGLGHVGARGGESDGTASDLDLTAAVVELSALLAVGLVQTDHLWADQVLSVLEVGKSHSDLALVVDELLHSELAGSQTLLEDLGPDSALTVGRGLGHVDHDGALVRLGNGLVGVTLNGGGVVVVPLEGDVGTSLVLDEVGAHLTAVADHGGGGDIQDGVVAVGGDLDTLGDILAVNDEGLEGGVGRDGVGSSQSESN